MLINTVLYKIQNLMNNVYEKSFVLKKIDTLIFINIIFIIISSAFLQSDSIGYFAIFLIILSVIKLLTKKGCHFDLTTAEKFLLLYFLIVLISVAGSTLLMLSIKGFCKTLIYLGFYVSVVHYLKDNINKLKYIFLAIAMTVFAETFVAIKQNFLSVSEIAGWQDMSRLNPEEVMTRVYGTLKPYNPNLFGGYLLATIPSALVLVFIPLINKHKKTALYGFLMFLFAITSIVLTGCRGAYLGLFAQLLLLAILTYHLLKPVYKKVFLFFSGVFALLSSLVIVSITSIRARIFSIFAMRNDSSNSFRFNVYNSCIEMFKDNWLLGIGVGNQNFREIYGLYMKTGFDALSAYNIYLEIAVESGVFALLAFLLFLFFNIKKAVYYITHYKNANTIYLGIALISIVGMLVHGLVDTVFFRPQIQFIFWIMIAVIRVITSSRSSYVK